MRKLSDEADVYNREEQFYRTIYPAAYDMFVILFEAFEKHLMLSIQQQCHSGFHALQLDLTEMTSPSTQAIGITTHRILVFAIMTLKSKKKRVSLSFIS